MKITDFSTFFDVCRNSRPLLVFLTSVTKPEVRTGVKRCQIWPKTVKITIFFQLILYLLTFNDVFKVLMKENQNL